MNLRSQRLAVVLLVAASFLECGSDPRDAFVGFFSGSFTATSDTGQTVSGTGQGVQVSKASNPGEVVLDADFFSTISIVRTLTATVSGPGLTFDDQSITFTTGNTSTLTVDGGAGTLGGEACQPLHSASNCLAFNVNWTDTVSGTAPVSTTVTFSGSKQ